MQRTVAKCDREGSCGSIGAEFSLCRRDSHGRSRAPWLKRESWANQFFAIHAFDVDRYLRCAVRTLLPQSAIDDLLHTADDHSPHAVAAPRNGNVVEPYRHETHHHGQCHCRPDGCHRRNACCFQGGDFIAGRHPAKDASNCKQHRAWHCKPHRFRQHVGNKGRNLKKAEPLLLCFFHEADDEHEERERRQRDEKHLQEFAQHIARNDLHGCAGRLRVVSPEREW